MASVIDTLPALADAMFSALIRVRRFVDEFPADVQETLYARGRPTRLRVPRPTFKGSENVWQQGRSESYLEAKALLDAAAELAS